MQRFETGDVLTFSKCEVTLISHNILHLRIFVNLHFEVEDILESFELINRLRGDRKFGNIVESGKNTSYGPGVHEIGAKPEMNVFTLAEAIIVHSLPQKLIGNFYMQLMGKSKIPTKMFSDFPSACSWLARTLENLEKSKKKKSLKPNRV